MTRLSRIGRLRVVLGSCTVVALMVAACSSDGEGDGEGNDAAPATTTAGAAPTTSATPLTDAPVESTTTATDAPVESTTPVLVRRPERAADFSGVVIVEWLNVSGGVDANPDFETLREEIMREGHLWVGVSAQVIGVEGGPVAVRVPGPAAETVVGKGLKGIDPSRYGSLQHPGDAFSYDIFTQVARALREGVPALKSLATRQPDTDQFRLWEVAGTAHADARTLGSNASSIDCGAPVNDGPLHLVAKAALRHFVNWVGSGAAPPVAPLLDVVEGDAPAVQRDVDGIALGGVRTPPVDVPVRILTSVPGRADSIICTLLGATNPMPADRLGQLYTSRSDYEQRYAAAADLAITAGFVLEEDRSALDEYAHADLVAG